jgi:putative beta barrel porin BBP7
MRRWIAGSLAGLCVSSAVFAQARDDKDSKTKSPVWVGKSSPPIADSKDLPADFPPPSESPTPIKPVSQPAPAKPAVRSTTTQAPASIAATAVPSAIPAITTDISAAPAGPVTTDGVNWPEPKNRVNGRVYGSAEYFLAWMRKGTNTGLVQTVSPADANVAIQTGELPPNATADIFGDGGTNPGAFSGVRGSLGVWLDECSNWGAEVVYTEIFRQSDGFNIVSPGIPVIGRNFIDVSANRQSFLRYTNPNGTQQGFINVDAPSQAVGGEFNIRYAGCAIFADRTEYLSGFRYFNLREALSIDSGSRFLTPAGAVTSMFDSSEFFRTRNEFYGGQSGFESHFYRGCWTLDVAGKIAMGNMHQEVLIQGSTTATQPGLPPQFFPNQSLLGNTNGTFSLSCRKSSCGSVIS